MSDETAVAVVTEKLPALVRPSSEIVDAIRDYRQLQTALDQAMPDCLITIQKRTFRKKNYWRAVATAFNLDVTSADERREAVGDDWGYEVTYVATAPNGRRATGEGACYASEKIVYKSEWDRGQRSFLRDDDGNRIVDTEKTSDAATVHNVRSHAHTRAYNRAVSNLVGFGEVSADELGARDEEPREEPRDDPKPRLQQPKPAPVVEEPEVRKRARVALRELKTLTGIAPTDAIAAAGVFNSPPTDDDLELVCRYVARELARREGRRDAVGEPEEVTAETGKAAGGDPAPAIIDVPASEDAALPQEPATSTTGPETAPVADANGVTLGRGNDPLSAALGKLTASGEYDPETGEVLGKEQS